MFIECAICGEDCTYVFHRCECGIIVCLDCATSCDACGERFCEDCWNTWTKDKDTEAGLNILDNSGENICYDCADKGIVKLLAKINTEDGVSLPTWCEIWKRLENK